MGGGVVLLLSFVWRMPLLQSQRKEEEQQEEEEGEVEERKIDMPIKMHEIRTLR